MISPTTNSVHEGPGPGPHPLAHEDNCLSGVARKP
jgi:hypothetical protein